MFQDFCKALPQTPGKITTASGWEAINNRNPFLCSGEENLAPSLWRNWPVMMWKLGLIQSHNKVISWQYARAQYNISCIYSACVFSSSSTSLRGASRTQDWPSCIKKESNGVKNYLFLLFWSQAALSVTPLINCGSLHTLCRATTPPNPNFNGWCLSSPAVEIANHSGWLWHCEMGPKSHPDSTTNTSHCIFNRPYYQWSDYDQFKAQSHLCILRTRRVWFLPFLLP